MTVPAGEYFASPDLYDLMYVGTRYDALYLEPARAAGGPVLEIGCGTGHVLVPLRAAGVDIDGLDSDPAMLERARERLAERGLETRLHHADMRDFTLPRRYALVVIPFNSFLHALSQADQIATLRCCREHLDAGGALMFDVFSPDVNRLLEHDGTPRLQMEHPHPSRPGTVRVTNATTSDPVEQVMHVTRTIEVRDAAGTPSERHEMAFRLRWAWKIELELLLRRAGFKRWAVEARRWAAEGFARKESLEPGDLMLWTAWKD
jgi:SAM-dependent methyltransferase